ncbi:MAG: hypothetical protein JXR96_09480 [Deltaproteobacteria bacterium]|nr:hypothetical protein [Deltaproteobacteria bacterium]
MRRLILSFTSLALLSSGPALASPAGLARLEAQNGRPIRVHGRAGDAQLVSGLRLAIDGASPAERALAFVQRYRQALVPGDELSSFEPVRTVPTAFGTAVHLRQRFRGLQVFGGSLVVSFGRDERVRMAIIDARPLGAAPPDAETCTADLAVQRAGQACSSAGFALRGAPRAETGYLPAPGGAFVVHRVHLPLSRPLGELYILVAGREARILYAFFRRPAAVGYAYPANPVQGPYEEVELAHLSSDEHLVGDFVEVTNCTGSSSGRCNVKQQLATPDGDGNYLIEPTGDDDPDLDDDRFVEVQAYYAINTIHDYFVSLGADPSPIDVGVNYPMADGPNAYYSERESDFGGGPAVLMGQWGSIDLALDNDVIFHEYGHHVFGESNATAFGELDDYGPVFFGLAFNEATADYFSCSALDDPVLGEYFASRMPLYMPEGYVRKVENELTCPEGLYGEGHDDGMVWSGFVWAVRQMLGAERADPLYLDVISHFPQQIDFPTATEVFLERAAEALEPGEVGEIRALAQARGIDVCERFLPLRAEGHTGFVYGKEVLGQYASLVDFVPAELHYFVELPEDATELAISLRSQPLAGTEITLLVRADQPVTHSLSMAGLHSDYDFELTAGGSFDLIEPDPAAPFEPGRTWYFQPANRDMPMSEYVLGASVIAPLPDGGTDGGTDGGGADGGAVGEGGSDHDSGCPEGFSELVDQGEVVCVPICGSGEELSKQDGTWRCVPAGEGCGCGASSATPCAWCMWVLLGLGAWRRLRLRGGSGPCAAR